EGKPVLYYGWSLHWLADTLEPGDDVVWLEVPFTTLPDRQAEDAVTVVDGKNVGFAVNQWGALGNREFMEANPAAQRFLEQVTIPTADIAAEMSQLRSGRRSQVETRSRAEAWVDAHEQEFEAWLKEARRAAQS
ncbi:MAG: glycine betaine ABC transporter substrate-binding protein, partial [Cyanobacteria bacterium J06639_1]